MTDFPGVPGTATIADLLDRPDAERLKVRLSHDYEVRSHEVWRHWALTAIVYVLAPPPDTITLPSGRTATLVGDGVLQTTVYGGHPTVTDLDDVPALAAWVTAHREAQT